MNHSVLCIICLHFLVFPIMCQNSQEGNYIGCYKDGDYPAMSIKTIDDQLTISTCLELCRSYQYTFAGLENGSECHCGEDFAKYGEVQGGCGTQCPGNNAEKCGAENQLSIYSTCSPGFYGTGCNQKCPFTCAIMTRMVCHMKTGKCCGEGTDSSDHFYCNFFDDKECGSVDGDKRDDVGDMNAKAGPNFNLFTTLTFPTDALVTEIVYYTRTADGRTEYVSFWRHLAGNNYMMVAKLELMPETEKKQTKMLNYEEQSFVQANDAVALHYPIREQDDMIPYKQGSPQNSDLHYYFNTQNTGKWWEAGYEKSFMDLSTNGRTPAMKIKYACIKACESGSFGDDCKGKCARCKNNDICHFVDGTCPNGCKPGYTNYDCSMPCVQTFGQNCSYNCSKQCLDRDCDNVNGTCRGCEAGFQGQSCSKECGRGFYGLGCNKTCGNCYNNMTCHHINGNCAQGCKPGYQGNTCHGKCDDYTFGVNCSQACGHCSDNRSCDHVDGKCQNGCDPGYKGDTCQTECERSYGFNCSEPCGNCSDKKPCDHIDGKCEKGCEPGYIGNFCKTECDAGYYGHNCDSTCGNCEVNTTCEFTHGYCEQGCEYGFIEPMCVHALNDPATSKSPKGSNNTAAVVASVLTVLIVAAVGAIVVVFVIRKKKLLKKADETSETNDVRFFNIGEDSDGMTASKKDELNISTVGGQQSIAKKENREKIKPDIVKPKIPAKPKRDSDMEYANMNPENRPVNPTMVSIHDLGNYIKIKQQSDEPFQEEFNLLPHDKDGCWDYSGQPGLTAKNRYKNIMPYDEYRVILPRLDEEPLTDYINASFIENYNGERAYIASHGPNKATVGDFWRMIWEHRVELVVMLTNLVEQMRIKCDQYWPSDGIISCGGVTIAVEKEELCFTYCKRHLIIKKGSEERKITHFHYTSWPDKGVPSQSSSILALRQTVRNYRDSSNQPVVIHCSAGVGRTGTFIAVDWLLDQAEQTGQVDVLACVRKLRQQRVNMVQTLIQYKFVYSTIHQVTQVGRTQIKCCDIQQKLSEILQTDSSGHSQIHKEYEYLEVEKRTITSETAFFALSSENKKKNKDMNVLPDEMSRIILPSSPMTYINAVHVEGFNYKTAYLATQIPLVNTAEDFWRMLLDFKCAAVVLLDNSEGTLNWFPEVSNHNQVGEFLIQNKHESKHSDITMYNLTVQMGDEDESEYANVYSTGKIEPRLFVCTSWSPSESGIATLWNLCLQVQNWVDQSDHTNVAVLCRNGASKTGVFIACSNLFNMINEIQEINVLELVKGIRKTRPQFISNLDEYTFLYEAAAAFVAKRQS